MCAHRSIDRFQDRSSLSLKNLWSVCRFWSFFHISSLVMAFWRDYKQSHMPKALVHFFLGILQILIGVCIFSTNLLCLDSRSKNFVAFLNCGILTALAMMSGIFGLCSFFVQVRGFLVVTLICVIGAVITSIANIVMTAIFMTSHNVLRLGACGSVLSGIYILEFITGCVQISFCCFNCCPNCCVSDQCCCESLRPGQEVEPEEDCSSANCASTNNVGHEIRLVNRRSIASTAHEPVVRYQLNSACS